MNDDADIEDAGSLSSNDDPTLAGDDSWTQVVQRHFDPGGGVELTTAIVTAIAAAEGVDPIELKSPTLHDVVDVPAIEQSFFGSNPHTEAQGATGVTQFRYREYLVKVRSDGWILIYE